jgi:hypothetical protein
MFEEIDINRLSLKIKELKSPIEKSKLRFFLTSYLSENGLKFDKCRSGKGHFNYKDYCDFVKLLLENGVIRKIKNESVTFLGKLSVDEMYEAVGL